MNRYVSLLSKFKEYHWKVVLHHLYDEMLKSHYRGLIGDMKADGSISINDLLKGIFPKTTLMLSIFVLAFFGFFVSPPSKVDKTVWIGVLSFEGAFVLGYVALSQWLGKMAQEGFINNLKNAIDAGVIPVESGVTGETFAAWAKDSKKAEIASLSIAGKTILHGALLLLFIVILMPSVLWINSQWEMSILVASVLWIVLIWRDLIAASMFGYDYFIWAFYRILKSDHDKMLGEKSCEMCSQKIPELTNGEIHRQSKKPWFKFNILLFWTVIWMLVVVWRHIGYQESNSLGKEFLWLIVPLPFYMLFVWKMIFIIAKGIKFIVKSLIGTSSD